MSIYKGLLIIIFSSAINKFCFAQAIFFSPYSFYDFINRNNTDNSVSSGTDAFSGLGYEHIINSKISVILSANASHSAIFNFGSEYTCYVPPGKYGTPNPATSNRENYNYISRIKYAEIQGQVKYLFKDQNESGPFFSFGVGYRFNSWRFSGVPNHYTNGFYDYSKVIRTREKFVVIPLTLKLGVRGVPEGFYSEGFLGVGYNLSFYKIPANNFLDDFFSYDPIRKFSFTFGYIFGLGWYD